MGYRACLCTIFGSCPYYPAARCVHYTDIISVDKHIKPSDYTFLCYRNLNIVLAEDLYRDLSLPVHKVSTQKYKTIIMVKSYLSVSR
jgi:hypothetical protein